MNEIDEDRNPISVLPFTVMADTRESAPYHFLGIEQYPVVPIKHCALKTGDYSILGLEDRLTIERKSVSDFMGSITGERDRFQREFERMSTMQFAAVVVEGQISDVLSYTRDKTGANMNSVVGTIHSWMIRYGVHFLFCMSRRHAEITTLNLLCQFWKQEQHRKKELVNAICT